jgi:hypothetical protein
MNESRSDTKLQFQGILYLNETDEERRIRLDVSRIILNDSIVEEVKRNYPKYYKEKR